MLTDSFVLNYLCDVVYAFHMPLFFMISGLLATKSSNRGCLLKNVLKKCAAYGIPYIAFSLLTWTLKAAASVVVNSKVDLFDLLMIFVYPINAMWFLYALMFISVIKLVLARYQTDLKLTLIIAMLVKFLATWLANTGCLKATGLSECFIIDVCKYYVWFEFGVYMATKTSCLLKQVQKLRVRRWSVLLQVALIITFSVVTYALRNTHFAVQLLITVAGTLLTLFNAMVISKMPVMEYLGKNTLPIYLLHGFVISAARIVITKLHLPVLGGFVPLVVGTSLGVLIPLGVYFVCKRFKFIDFWFNPLLYLFPKHRKQE